MIFFPGSEDLTVVKFVQLCKKPEVQIQFPESTLERARLQFDAFQIHAERNEPVYGFTTGFGGNAESRLQNSESEGLQRNLSLYLDCGTGAPLGEEFGRAALLARLHVLSRGYSCVSPQLLSHLSQLVNSKVSPYLVSQGSLGASGDLVSMAPLARLVQGDDVECFINGKLTSAVCAFEQADLRPLKLKGRDGLALMNGLSCTTAILAIECEKLRRLFDFSLMSLAANHLALNAIPESLDSFVNSVPVRKHSGQSSIAARLRSILQNSNCSRDRGPQRLLQDEYSLRCVPQTLGPALEMLDTAEHWIEQELNSVSDNPIFDESAKVFSGGNFYGGYLVAAGDFLSLVCARLSDLIDRQTFLLIDGKHDLPPNLIVPSPNSPRYHGMKGIHQLMNALTMDIQSKAIPSALFVRSCEAHNQDIVSNAMNGAMRLTQVCDTLASIVSAQTLLALQALSHCPGIQLDSKLKSWHRQMSPFFEAIVQDTPLRTDLLKLKNFVLTDDPNLSQESDLR